MKKKSPLILGCVFLILLVFAGCREVPHEVQEPELRPVRYIEVQADEGLRVRTFTGLARAGMASRMSFRVSGTLQKLHVRVGDVLEKGQLIAELDATDFQLKLQEAEAALSRAQAQARNAEAIYGRVQALYERRNASRSELDAARTGAESAEAAVRSIENQLALARRQLTYARLEAPDRCAVAAVPVEKNENVGAGQAVAVINCGTGVDVRIAVPAIHISGVREGMPVKVRVDALGNGEYTGIITEVGVSSMGLETTFPVTVRLEDPDVRILPGMAAEVDVSMDVSSSRGPVVPFRSVGEDGKGRFVYSLDLMEDGETARVRRQAVEVAGIRADGLEIAEGLQPGDLLVTAGIAHIHDGLRVKLWKEGRP
ncbi:RND family efflux transporter MFP subunit [Desulfobotulus alkaliphilus]|uniref:RND family efflux transporter MFP subunit n=1 Tax=Desulfobotulus alkaliphilus TaxID=622671 RepID=A0A562RTP6_9BACT|nr:efflux RND transporter periplasmic adaptor subunit [Desulfobotulus alkaliphilus]TWI72442.1 RND family efflux transporter MFP subunit [Desulfobotulus alkaliphilus]